jgi:hypothetical protein
MPLMRWERVIGTALGVSITCFGGNTYERCVGVSAMFHDGICLNAQLSKSIRRSSDVVLFLYCCLVVVPVVGGHFHVVNIQGRAPENEEERKERHERGETSRATQWNNLTKKLFSTRDGEKTFSFWLLLLDIGGGFCRFDEGAKKSVSNGKTRSCVVLSF